MKPRSISFVSCIVLSLTAAHAQSTWEGNTSNDWGTATNWNPAAVPATGTNIVIADTTGSSSVMVLDVDREVGSWTFGNTGIRTSSFNVRHADNTLTFNGGLVADGAHAGVGLNFYGDVTIAADQTWSIGGDIGAHNADRGVFIREVRNAANSITGVGSLVLDGNLTKTNTGQLDLAATTVSGAGNFIVDEGALKFNAGVSSLLTIGGTGNITINNDAQLFVSKNSGSMDITRDIILNGSAGMVWGGGGSSTNSTVASAIAWDGSAHTLQIANNGNKYTSSGDWTGTATVNRTGAGSSVLTLTGDNSAFTGTLAMIAGTTNVNGVFGGNINSTGGTTNLNNTVAGNITLGAGATLTGEVTAGGNLTLNGGSFGADATTGASLGATNDLTLTGTNTVNLTANPTSTAPFTVLAYGGSLTGGVANLTLAGGATSYRSPTFDDGTSGIITLAVGSASQTWNGGAAWDVNTSDNWTGTGTRYFQLDDVTFGDTGAGSVALTGNLAPGSITVNNSSGNDYTFTAASGNLISGSTDLTKSGAGNLTIGGSNTFNGGITVNGGTLTPTGSQALGANGQVITIASGAALDANGKMNVNRDYHAVISGTGVGSTGAIVNTGADHNNAFGKITLAADATIGGTGRWDLRPITAGTAELNLGGYTLTKTGSNTIALVDGTISQPGTIKIDQGTLAVTRTNVTGTGSIDVNSGGTLMFEGSTGTIDKAININGGTLKNVTSTATVNSPITVTGATTFQMDRDLLLSNSISGAGSIEKTGGYTMALTGDASHTGGTTISSGTLQLGDNGTTGTIAGNITNNSILRFKRSDDISFGGDVSGSGYIDKEGTGTLTLTGALTYTGKTDVDVGTLKIAGGNDTLPTGTTLEIANTAGVTLDLNGLNQEVQALTGGGTTGGVVINSGGGTSTLSIRPTGDRAFSGNINGDVRVEIVGSKGSPSGSSPRQQLNGTASTYTGGTLVDGATLRIKEDGSLGAVPGSFDAANITLQNNGSMLNSDSAPVLHANRGITLGTGGGGLVAGWNKNLTVQSVISGAVGNNLTVVGNSGTIILTGNNTFAGDVLLTSATSRMQIGNGGTSGTLGTGNVTNDGSLTFNRSDASSYAGDISGSGTLTKMGVGALTLGGDSTYDGNTTVSAGTLLVNGSLGNTAVTIASGATLGGGGTIAGAVSTGASGSIISPGNSPGALVLGALDVSNGATLDFELGLNSDLLDITGALTAGTNVLDFNFSDSGGISINTAYTLFTYDSQTGLDYVDLNAATLPGDFTLDPSFGTDGWLIGTSGLQVQFVPEPSAAILLAFAGAFGMLRRRRR